MKFVIESTLSEERAEEALDYVLKQGIGAQMKLTLTESVFLVGLAIMMGASNMVIGILAAIPSLAQLIQVPAIALTERYESRKQICFHTQLANRLAITPLLLVPFLPPTQTSLLLLSLAVLLQAVFISIGAPSWNTWLKDLVPQERMGRYFSNRMTLNGLVAVLSLAAGGAILGLWSSVGASQALAGYSIIYLVALVAGLVSIRYTLAMPEPHAVRRPRSTRMRDLVAEPFKDTNFRNLLIFSGVWFFAASLSAPFFTVYLLKRLDLSIVFASFLVGLTQIVTIVFLRSWGRLSDQLSNKSILLVAVPLFLVGVFLWTMISAVSALLVIPLVVLIHLLVGFSAAGVNLSTTTIGLKLAPSGEADSYLAARGAIVALAGAFGSILGGIMADLFEERTLAFSVTWTDSQGASVLFTYSLTGLDFVFVISVFVGIYAVHRLVLVRETGEVDPQVALEAVLADLRRNVRTLSTIDGLRHTFQVPLTEVKRLMHHDKNHARKQPPKEQSQACG